MNIIRTMLPLSLSRVPRSRRGCMTLISQQTLLRHPSSHSVFVRVTQQSERKTRPKPAKRKLDGQSHDSPLLRSIKSSSVFLSSTFPLRFPLVTGALMGLGFATICGVDSVKGTVDLRPTSCGRISTLNRFKRHFEAVYWMPRLKRCRQSVLPTRARVDDASRGRMIQLSQGDPCIHVGRSSQPTGFARTLCN